VQSINQSINRFIISNFTKKMGMGKHGHSHSHSHKKINGQISHESDSNDEHDIDNKSHPRKRDGHGHSHGGGKGHGHSHSHGHSHGGGGKKFCGCCHFSDKMRISSMLAMTFFFFLVEIIAGQITKSISLTTDAFHMLSDALALCIGLFSIIVSLLCNNIL
jgi:cobalt-zinc-cadmium efflux system protein